LRFFTAQDLYIQIAEKDILSKLVSPLQEDAELGNGTSQVLHTPTSVIYNYQAVKFT
jgi:hypothetical protein